MRQRCGRQTLKEVYIGVTSLTWQHFNFTHSLRPILNGTNILNSSFKRMTKYTFFRLWAWQNSVMKSKQNMKLWQTEEKRFFSLQNLTTMRNTFFAILYLNATLFSFDFFYWNWMKCLAAISFGFYFFLNHFRNKFYRKRIFVYNKQCLQNK